MKRLFTQLLTILFAVMMLPIRDPVQLAMGGGAGAWQTVIQLYTDGSFFGRYLDRDPGDIGEGYPKGTADICDFRGKVAVTAHQTRDIYSVEISELETVQPQGGQWIEDGTRYRGTAPYGLEDDTAELIFYAPNVKVSDLDADAARRDETLRQRLDSGDSGPLGCYAIYNIRRDHWFFSATRQALGDELDRATLPNAERIDAWLADKHRSEANAGTRQAPQR